MYAQLKRQFLELQRATREHEQLLALRRELDIASNIQQSILPRVFPPFPGRADFDIFAQMIPAREVGGDFYDFFLVDDGHLGIVVGDVSGKGMPAALFMAVSRTLLKSNALAGLAPGDCLHRVNQLLCLENSAEMFVSIFYGILDTRTGAFEYCNGGHNRPYLLRRGGAAEMLEGTGGTVLGVLDSSRYGARRITLQPGEGVFLYSDGVTEAMDAGGAVFSDGRLLATLEHHGAASPEALIAAVVEDVNRHAGGVAQSDDITTLAVRWRGGREQP
jgi:sigma-B regulation protein RsbU (phosphoserine phosphatase)